MGQEAVGWDTDLILLINKKRHMIMINCKAAPDHDKDDEKEANAKEQHRCPRKTPHRGFVKERKQINIEQLQY